MVSTIEGAPLKRGGTTRGYVQTALRAAQLIGNFLLLAGTGMIIAVGGLSNDQAEGSVI